MDAQRASGYVSDELTHFLGRKLGTDDDRFDLLLKILDEGLLRSPHDPDPPWTSGITFAQGMRICSDETMYHRGLVCFCDIPPEHFGVHIKKYKGFGIAFKKGWLVERGASPVFYVASTAPLGLHGTRRTRAEVFNERAAQHQELMLAITLREPPPSLPENFRKYLDQLQTVMDFEAQGSGS